MAEHMQQTAKPINKLIEKVKNYDKHVRTRHPHFTQSSILELKNTKRVTFADPLVTNAYEENPIYFEAYKNHRMNYWLWQNVNQERYERLLAPILTPAHRENILANYILSKQ